MEIKLKKLSIRNFKGIPDRNIEFSAPTIISGANATGKTTVFDAFTFLLFGKNSNGEEKFQMRPLNDDGSVIHNTEIVIDGEFELDYGETAKTVTLKKTTKEKWVKRRGSDTTELQGNETTYEIDGYPRTEREYKEFISGLIDEKVFRMITNPKYFPNLPWKEQRAILMSLITQKTDAELARSMGGYEDIIDELEKAPSTDDILTKYRKSLNELKKEQAELPVRIDEVYKQGNDAAQQNSVLRTELSEVEASVSNVSFEDYNSKFNDAVLERTRLETELRKANAQFDSEQSDKKFASMEAIRKAEYDYTVASGDVVTLSKSAENHKAVLQSIKNEIAEAEHNLEKLSQEQMDESKAVCPVCGRRFTEKKIGKLKEEFYKHINEQMQFLRGLITEKNGEFQAASLRIDEISAELHQKKIRLVNAETALKEAKASYQEPESVRFVETDIYKDLSKQITDVIAAIDKYGAARADQDTAMKENADKLARIEIIKAAIKTNETIVQSANDRITELQGELRKVGDKVNYCEKMVNLVEKFIREKMDIISSQINDKFEFVNWKLFETQINGGLKETCECTISGVPYGSANNGHQIIAGLDVIKTLQSIYGAKAPIFIDNAESVNTFNYPDMDCQMVFLRVTDDNELKITTA